MMFLTRWLQLAPTLILFGAALFACYGLDLGRSKPQPGWLRPLLQSSAGLALLATGGWLLVEASSFADDPATPLWETVRIVLLETHFGLFALLRLLLLAGLLVTVALSSPTRHLLGWLSLPAAVATASFVGTGHGTSPGGRLGLLHALADTLHLWAAGIWLGALASLCLMTVAARDESDSHSLLRGLLRFSIIGPVVVAVLALTGIANSAMLLGAAPWHALLASSYGQSLLLKLVLFAVMLACAAINRYALTPRLSAPGTDIDASAAIRGLRRVIGLESAVAIALIAVVAWLGALAPPQ
jgi:putative copper resistance protein D